MDEWYWKTDGWTICRIRVAGADTYEVWRQGADAASAVLLPSFEAAQAKQAELAA
jgi:hypothetical protein